MLRYDFDIIAVLGPRRPGGAFAVKFRDRSTASAFANAAEPIRAWLMKAGFRDGVSGSVLVPGCYPEADDIDRDTVMEALERTMPDVLACRGFDPREFITQSLRARPEPIANARLVQMAAFWSRGKSATAC